MSTYWNHKGKYQEEYKALWKHIPRTGRCDDVYLEAVRCVSNLYYDLYNNGGGNWEHCYKEEWRYIQSFRHEFPKDEITEEEFQELEEAVGSISKILEDYEVEVVSNDEKSLCELFEKLSNAVIAWAWKQTDFCRLKILVEHTEAEELTALLSFWFDHDGLLSGLILEAAREVAAVSKEVLKEDTEQRHCTIENEVNVRRHMTAYKNGKQEYHDGIKRGDNPYQEEDLRYWWDRGWNDADFALKVCTNVRILALSKEDR